MEEEEFKETISRLRCEFQEAELEQILEAAPWKSGDLLDAQLRHECGGAATEKESADMRAKLSKMSMPEKMKAAMFGNAVVRAILVYDPNKMIQECVLRNPRLMLPEVETFVKNSSISDHVLRLVSNTKDWTKYYSIKLNLVCNPKTPQDLALKWLRHMTGNDLKKLARSKNIPHLVASTAQKILAAQEAK